MTTTINNDIYIDASYRSLNKHTEELCGDRVEIVKNDDCCIIVLSDGLGSGVKANILSTLTSKIISTMLVGGSSIEDAVDTIVHTLPVCSVRKVAYSTFSILKIGYDRQAYLVEFDSPDCVYIKNGEIQKIDYTTRQIAGKKIKEASFKVDIGDVLTLMSDGVIYAGIGALLNLGWGWKHASQFIGEKAKIDETSFGIVNSVAEKCSELYLGKPGDDTTIASVKILPKKAVNIFTGPPQNPENDSIAVRDFLKSEGIKIVAGGSSATILSRVTGEKLVIKLEYFDPEIPPVACINGVDLVTEGVLTLRRTLDILKAYFRNPSDKNNIAAINKKDGASRIAKILAGDCTHVNLFVGRKINPAHQNPNLPIDLNIRMRIVDDLYGILVQAGKTVVRKYY